MTYNSYLMDAGSAYILLGTLPARYDGAGLEEIKEIVGDGKIGWAVLLGTDDDRAAARLLLGAYPGMILIGGTNTLFRLEGFTEADFRSIEVRTDRSLVLGDRRLEFRVLADPLGTYLYVLDRESGVLLTVDAFGSVYAPDKTLVSDLKDRREYLRGAARYFVDISGQKRRQTMASAAALVRESGTAMICPACGPVADAGLEELLALYTVRVPEEPKTPTVALAYAPRQLCPGAGRVHFRRHPGIERGGGGDLRPERRQPG